jgi:phosphatidate phosphatase APP1
MRLRRLIAHAGSNVEDLVERVRPRRRQPGPLQIVAYRSYGSANGLRLSGRVLEDRGILPAVEHASRIENFRAAWRRFGSRELPGARVCATFMGLSAETLTDAEGYFQLQLAPPSLYAAPWQHVPLELPAYGVRAVGEVLVPPATARYAVISDVDDTVLQSYATDLLKMVRLTFLGNARTRLPFTGVASLYHALVAGASGHDHNPIFYVSSSPWNLYDFLIEFMAIHDLPQGPLLLSDYGLDHEKVLKSSHAEHKLAHINAIAATYPHLPLVLIGDSGQQDPEIYLRAAQDLPGRVSAIYIRHVSHTRRAGVIETLVARAAGLGVPMLLASDSAGVAADACARGLIATGG